MLALGANVVYRRLRFGRKKGGGRDMEMSARRRKGGDGDGETGGGDVAGDAGGDGGGGGGGD